MTERSWSQVPQAQAQGPSAGDHRGPLATLALPLLVLGPARWVLEHHEPGPAPVLAVAIAAGAVAATGVLGGRRHLARLLVAGVAATLAAAVAGRLGGAWVGTSVVLADWAVRRRSPLPVVRAGHAGALPPVVVLQAVAIWRSGAEAGSLPVAVLLALSLAVTAVTAYVGGATGRLIDGVAQRVASLVSIAAFGLLGLLVVVLPGVAASLLRVDLLDAPRGTSAFARRERRDVRSAAPWSPESVVGTSSAWARVRRSLVAPLSVAILAGLVSGTWWIADRVDGDSTTPEVVDGWDPQHPPAAAGEQWWPQYAAALAWIFEGGVFDPFRLPRMRDIRSPYINVEDGDRVSWQAPACSCRRTTVWLYGGSTAFGLGQRDDHTIASELARLAHDDGIVVDVVNRGVPGDLHWQEAQRFAWDVAGTDRPPDLVVFYDGYNDLVASASRNNDGEGDDESPTDQVMDRLRREGVVPDGPNAPEAVAAPPGGSIVTRPEVRLPPEELAAHAIGRYEHAREVSRAAAEGAGVPVRWFWQPTVRTRPPVDGDYRDEPSNDTWSRALFAAARRALAPDVVDLGSAFDSLDGPVYYDEVHTNERGARVVATAIYAQLRDDLRPRAVEDGE